MTTAEIAMLIVLIAALGVCAVFAFRDEGFD
jgi:hypothetical protein